MTAGRRAEALVLANVGGTLVPTIGWIRNRYQLPAAAALGTDAFCACRRSRPGDVGRRRDRDRQLVEPPRRDPSSGTLLPIMRRRDFLQLSGLAAMHAVAPRGGASQENTRLKDIEALVTAKMTEYHVPGVALGIVKAGRVETRTFGVTSVESPQPITVDTVFPIMSITKTVAATAIMRLVQDGKVAVSAPVQQYLPDFRVKDEAASRAVTVAHLLAHTPGWEGQLSIDDRGAETHARFTSGLRDLPQLAVPGEVWSYNNAGFGVAGRILEVVTGKTIHDALRDLVFAPLELSHAFTQTGTAMTYRFAVAHRQQKSGPTEVIRPFELPLNVTAGGGAMSLASLLRYAQFHLGGGKVGAQQVLSSALVQQM